MGFLNKRSTKWLLIITGFFTIEGVVSFFYSLIRGHYISYEAILLTIIMLCFFLHFHSKRVEDFETYPSIFSIPI